MSTALGLPEPMTRRVVAAAGMAPSLFNTQPWKFRLRLLTVVHSADKAVIFDEDRNRWPGR